MNATPSYPIIRDMIDPADVEIDDTFQGVLAYRDGRTRWPVQQVRRYRDAGKHIYPITVTGANPHIAQIADRENGDLTAVGAANWGRERNALHHDATIYVDLDNVPGVVEELGDEPCWLWVAWWTGRLMLPTLQLPAHIKLAAVQYTSGGLFDTSAIVNPDWPGHPFTTLAEW